MKAGKTDIQRAARIVQLVVLAAVALSAAAGGVALVVGSLVATGSSIVPSLDYLAGSPFSSYLVPGLILLLVVGGLHASAFGALLRRSRLASIAIAVAACGLLIWIFVQMTVIPFSPLQAAYEAAAIIELALLLVQRGVLDDLRRPAEPSGGRGQHEPAA
jgi:hypothetical protein